MSENGVMASNVLPEVHLIGELRHGSGFGEGVSCRYRLEGGRNWVVLEGSPEGQTQAAYGFDGSEAVWNHPFDLHWNTSTLGGWPKLILSIQQLDDLGRVSIIGHGYSFIPSSPGEHDL